MKASEVYIGKKFSRLVITEIGVEYTDITHKKKSLNKVKHKCKCQCGNVVFVLGYNLISGNTKSCGCLGTDRTAEALRKTNQIEVCGDSIKIYFFNKKHGFALIDKEDYDAVKDRCWHKSTIGYAVSNPNKLGNKQTRMHRLIYSPPAESLVDHINGDKLDNRKANLRICNKSQNGCNTSLSKANTSGVKGVWFDKARKKWVAEMMHQGVKYRLGDSYDFVEACQLRAEAEEKYQKDFSTRNSRGGTT